MGLDLGDWSVYGDDALVMTEVSDGTGSAGHFVALDGSGSITSVGGTGCTIYGVLASPSSSANAGSLVRVVKHGTAVAFVGSATSQGDILGSSSGGVAVAMSNGKEVEGGSFSNDFAPANPEALTDQAGNVRTGDTTQSLSGSEAVVDLK